MQWGARLSFGVIRLLPILPLGLHVLQKATAGLSLCLGGSGHRVLTQLPAPNPPEPSFVFQLGALQAVLEKLQKRIPPWGKKLGHMPAVRSFTQCQGVHSGQAVLGKPVPPATFFLQKCL
uniref:Uncharacterized protein n=1 Tax=Pelusios castaneus TaxID=367368 RepID=A0A8C8RZL7_9SAUR